MKKIYAFTIALSFSIQAMEKHNSYRGEKISAKNILPLMQRISPMPQECEVLLSRFLSDKSGPISAFIHPILSDNDLEKECKNQATLINWSGLKNVSDSNYSFEIGEFNNNKLLLQIPSTKNRVQNLKMAYRIKKEELRATFETKPTFLNASHAGACLKFLDLKKTLNIQKICLPELYLVGDSGGEASDEKCVLVRNLVSADKATLVDMDLIIFNQLLGLIEGMPLSTITDETIQKDAAGFYYLTPSEDEFQHNPNNFYFNNKEEYELCALRGFRSLLKLIKNDENKRDALKEFVRSHMPSKVELLNETNGCDSETIND